MHAVSSMTGYAVAEGLSPLGKISVECRAVNSRFLDLTLRMDESLRFADGLVREQIQKRVARGKMEVRISLKASEAGLPTSLNEAALRRIAELQASIRKVIPETPPLTVAELLEMPGIAETAGADRDELAASILKVLDEALTAFSARAAGRAKPSPRCFSTTVPRWRRPSKRSAPKSPASSRTSKESSPSVLKTLSPRR